MQIEAINRLQKVNKNFYLWIILISKSEIKNLKIFFNSLDIFAYFNPQAKDNEQI